MQDLLSFARKKFPDSKLYVSSVLPRLYEASVNNDAWILNTARLSNRLPLGSLGVKCLHIMSYIIHIGAKPCVTGMESIWPEKAPLHRRSVSKQEGSVDSAQSVLVWFLWYSIQRYGWLLAAGYWLAPITSHIAECYTAEIKRVPTVQSQQTLHKPAMWIPRQQ